jgi:Leucine-rich repeat (LRR) protein
LTLRSNQLTSVPAELGDLNALEVLRLEFNKLTSVPASLGALTALTRLDLSGKQLTSVPASLGALTALTRLDLRNNQLATVPAALGNLKALTRLDVAWNPDLAALPEEVEQLSTTHGGKCTINDNVMKRAVPTPADRDRSILLEWRASSTKL